MFVVEGESYVTTVVMSPFPANRLTSKGLIINVFGYGMCFRVIPHTDRHSWRENAKNKQRGANLVVYRIASAGW